MLTICKETNWSMKLNLNFSRCFFSFFFVCNYCFWCKIVLRNWTNKKRSSIFQIRLMQSEKCRFPLGCASKMKVNNFICLRTNMHKIIKKKKTTTNFEWKLINYHTLNLTTIDVTVLLFFFIFYFIFFFWYHYLHEIFHICGIFWPLVYFLLRIFFVTGSDSLFGLFLIRMCVCVFIFGFSLNYILSHYLSLFLSLRVCVCVPPFFFFFTIQNHTFAEHIAVFQCWHFIIILSPSYFVNAISFINFLIDSMILIIFCYK